jgi:hypothetical protein
MAAPHYFTSVGTNVSIDLAAQFAGYTSSPKYSVSGVVNGAVTVAGTTATFKPAKCGMASWTLKVTDSAGSSRTKTMGAFVDGGSGACP